MNNQNKNRNNQPDLLDQSAELFERTRIPFGSSQEDSWKVITSRIHSVSQAEDTARHLFFNKRSIALAATLTLLLSVGTFFRLFRVQTLCPPGENITVKLPDGSLAELNEQTTIYFHPLWWPLSREVHLKGEAFFNVNEGKEFTVVSSVGTTEVLGTTFTVFARDNRYRVTCHTGRVRISEASSENSVSLSQNERAELNKSGEIEVRRVWVEPFSPAWKGKLLMFTSSPLKQVLDEIEERFGIKIETPKELDHIYTGNFSMDQPVEKILSLICQPFDLEYEKRSGSYYHIFPSSVD